jgi:hypothetical protein
MIEPRKQAYLEAMGFDVWVARPERPLPGRLIVEAGEGSTLLVVPSAEDKEIPMARDIARACPDQPAWAWPDPEGRPDSPALEGAVENGLFTQVVVFGQRLADELFKGEAPPQVIASSAVTVVAALDDLATRGSAKQELWRLMASGAATSPVS